MWPLDRTSGCRSYTGYIDIEARHIFFYFFESRSDPAKDDVIFWTNGGRHSQDLNVSEARSSLIRLAGPGCSSSMGLYMELGKISSAHATGSSVFYRVAAGPCRVVNSTSTEYFEESWTSNANVFFVDQPIGVGFSYADYGESVVCIDLLLCSSPSSPNIKSEYCRVRRRRQR